MMTRHKIKSGEQIALKHSEPLDASIQIRCLNSDKEKWKTAAKARQMSLTDFVIAAVEYYLK